SPSRRSYRSRNEEFYHSAERITGLSSSSGNSLVESSVRKKSSLPYRTTKEHFYHSRVRAKKKSVSSGDIGLRSESPAFRPYRSRNEDFDNSARIIRTFSSPSANIFARPESPSRRSYRSRNEKFYHSAERIESPSRRLYRSRNEKCYHHSAERITGLPSSSGNILVESSVRRNRSLSYRSTHEYFYHPRAGAKRLSVSSGDIGLRP
ncbi:Hypothetical predicted protein, partial [Paramuricea clavata]